MADLGTLVLVRQRTADLVAQRLRSDAAVIARLSELILEAVRLGHSHRSIHEAITAGGLATSWTNYRISLGRARKLRRAQAPTDTAKPVGESEVTTRPVVPNARSAVCVTEADLVPTEPLPPGTSGTSATTEVLDALRRARQTASKDYSRIARAQLREKSRAQSRLPARQPLPKEPP